MSYTSLIERIEREQAENLQRHIPLNLGRLTGLLNIRPANYTLLGGGTGTGKTSFVDEKFVIEPYEWVKQHGAETGLSVRYFYRSMERRQEFKLAKWVTNKIYYQHGMILDPKVVLRFSNNQLSDDVLVLLKKYIPYFEEMLDYVDIHDGQESPYGMFKPIEDYAYKNGVFFKVVAKDKIVVKYDHSTSIEKVCDFTETKYEITKTGEKRYFEEVEYRNKKYKIYYGKPVYIADKPNEIVMPVIDHIGKTRTQEGMDDRASINKVSENMSYVRDTFGHSPIIISQFNRALSDVNRMRMFKGDLQPQLEDFESSARTQHDADLVLALFNPYRYKSWDDEGKYMGYDIRQGTIGVNGENRFRTISILKDSYGMDDVIIPLKFMGEIGAFSVMPPPDSMEAMVVYEQIANGN